MSIEVDLYRTTESTDVPEDRLMRLWVKTALTTKANRKLPRRHNLDLSIRIVDEPESQRLNHRYRGKPVPTNVLAFPADITIPLSEEWPENLPFPLGDLAICAPVVKREAEQQNKACNAHWAHMVIHGVLHLIGYDHLNNFDAEQMEALEAELVTGLGFPPPWKHH